MSADACSGGQVICGGVFYEDSFRNYYFVQQVPLTTTSQSYTVPIGGWGRYLIVSRIGSGWSRDDVYLNSVTACE